MFTRARFFFSCKKLWKVVKNHSKYVNVALLKLSSLNERNLVVKTLFALPERRTAKMKYSTSPTPSRSNSTSLLGMSSSRTTSPLPPPANYRNDCMSATNKSYKYLRRFVKFDQMDFEFAMWQMLYLFIAPKKVYRNFNYRKRKTKPDRRAINDGQHSLMLFFSLQKPNLNLLVTTRLSWCCW